MDTLASMDDGYLPEDGWCMECGDEFHLDDCGGYNPPCSCGLHCRSCHDAEAMDDYNEYGDDDYAEDPPATLSGNHDP